MKDAAHQFAEPVPRTLCTDCGVSRMQDPSACGVACQFIKPDYPSAETTVHGRQALEGDETFFGVHQAMYRAALTSPRKGAQWTGLTTRLAERLLEDGAVDAVLTMVPDRADSWKPTPALITKPQDMAQARGMRMGYAPLLALLEPAAKAGHKRIAVIGIPCQIYALRALEANDFFPLTCKTCVDYTNRLADITVGYMAGEGDQWLIVRNTRGKEMLDRIKDEVRLATPGTRGNRISSVKGFIENTKRAAGGLPLRRMPNFMRGVMGWLMPRVGPRGIEFAKARLEMKAAETVLHLQREEPAKVKNMVPDHVWKLTQPYGLGPDGADKKPE